MKIKRLFQFMFMISILGIINCNTSESGSTTTTDTTTTTTNTGPFQSIAFDVSAATLGDTIVPTVTLNQPDSTIQGIDIYMTGGWSQSCWAVETTAGSGIYQCNYTVQQWDSANFQIESFYLSGTSSTQLFMDSDADGFYDELDIYTGSFIGSTSTAVASVTITGTTPDVTPPVVNSVTLAGTPTGAGGTYQSGDMVTVTIVATDAVSGVSTTNSGLVLYTINSNLYLGGGWLFSPTANPDEYAATITIQGNSAMQYFNDSVYADLWVEDNAGILNYLYYPGSGTTYSNSAITIPTLPLFYNTTPPAATPITVNDTVGTSINLAPITPGYYSFPVTMGQNYTVILDDANGSGTYTGSYWMTVFSMGSFYFDNDYAGGSNYPYGIQFTATSTGTVYIEEITWGAGTANLVVTSP